MAFGPALPLASTPGLARAAHCRAAAPALRMAVSEVGSESELDAAIANAGDDKLVVIDYSTTWCGPCKVVAPKFEEFSNTYTDAIFLKCVGDSSPDATKLMKREGIRSVPAFHFWKKGAKVEVIAGANVQALENTIKDNL
eukprot:Tamp_22240.p1 GENE.Tamp_22240~~Tamp_22240.p1  ORF type:complete len:153 (-),score=43.42 Tamp_22240:641-1060(-)